MSFDLFKKYLCTKLTSAEYSGINFSGSFIDALHRNTSHEESIVLLLALAPHILPHFLDNIIKEIQPDGGDFPEIGGVRLSNHRGLLPTGETAQWILAANDISERLEVLELFKKDHWFYRDDILYLESVEEGEPFMSGRIILTQKGLSLLIYGIENAEHDYTFPAQKLETNLEWEDLVLPEGTKKQIDEIISWEKHKELILQHWKQARFFKKGYRTLFYGPSGTGKTMTASLIGKELSLNLNREIPVYRIDLSQIVSKYVGETEKNLGKLFAKAEHKNWILFFDEGENFFSNRTNIKDANDKYANQEVSYLLQRIEDYNGLVIVATNLKSNIDDAFARRFQSMIEFKLPNEQERESLWNNILPDITLIPHESDLIPQLLKYNLSGGNIVNVVQYACLKGAEMPDPLITAEHCITGIRRELAKVGKTI
jgi:AAA+ superfamily predicted ATPase